MLHSSYIEISKSALQNNIRFLQQELGPDVQLSSVIKGNAYGHGIEQFAPMAQACGIEHFSVFSADEADRLQQVLPGPATIMIMGYLDTPEIEWAIGHGIEFFSFELERLQQAAQFARKLNRPALVHLELETGMNRTGLDKPALQQAVALLQKSREWLQLKGICTHFAGAESMQNHDRVMRQFEIFNKELDYLKQQDLVPEQQHTACSAASITYPVTRLNMVRIGIMQYGLWPSPETYSHYISQHSIKKDPLRRLITWKSRVMSIKSVPQGDFIGYGDSYQATRDMVLAIVPVGYAWGYSRALSNQGQVLIKGTRAAVVGIVNMNVMMVDITNIPGVAQDDEVVLLGRQGDESITVASFGELSTQLNYELLTRLPTNIPRYVID